MVTACNVLVCYVHRCRDENREFAFVGIPNALVMSWISNAAPERLQCYVDIGVPDAT
jgi:hypothetical protein